MVSKLSENETSAADSELVGRAVSGDANAFEQLFERHREAVYAVSWRYLRNREAALDIAQEAFVRAYEKLATFRREANFYTWVRRIASNLCIDHLRASENKNTFFEESVHGDGRALRRGVELSPIRKVEQAEFTEALWEALDRLSDHHRAVFIMHAVEEVSYKEMAERMGCQVGTVMSRLYYARKNLQELLQEHMD